MQQASARLQQDTNARLRQISQTLHETTDIINSTFWQRQVVQDRVAHHWSNAMLGRTDVIDSSGTTYSVPNDFDQVWRDRLSVAKDPVASSYRYVSVIERAGCAGETRRSLRPWLRLSRRTPPVFPFDFTLRHCFSPTAMKTRRLSTIWRSLGSSRPTSRLSKELPTRLPQSVTKPDQRASASCSTGCVASQLRRPTRSPHPPPQKLRELHLSRS